MLSFDTHWTRGKRSPALEGRYDVDQALQILLSGTGLQATRESDGRYSLLLSTQQGDVLELAPSRVDALGLGNVTEGTGAYTTGGSTSATKLPLTLRETPQSVSVITRQVIDDHGSQDIGDVLRNTPGVSVQAYDSERMEYSARGFAITNYQYDGINTIYDGVYDEGVTHVDMAPYDRIEVIKGATG